MICKLMSQFLRDTFSQLEMETTTKQTAMCVYIRLYRLPMYIYTQKYRSKSLKSIQQSYYPVTFVQSWARAGYLTCYFDDVASLASSLIIEYELYLICIDRWPAWLMYILCWSCINKRWCWIDKSVNYGSASPFSIVIQLPNGQSRSSY